MNKLQIAIATKQPLANLIPLLMDPPEILWLLVSTEMQQAADEFVRFVRKVPTLSHIEIVSKTVLPDSPYRAIEDFGMELAADLEQHYASWEKTYNTTGGTKLMAMALTAIFNEQGYRQIYVNTASDQVEQLYPRGDSIPLPHLLGTKDYLEAHDVTWRKANSDDPKWLAEVSARESATLLLAKAIAKADNAQNFLSMLNGQLVDMLDKDKQLRHPHVDLKFLPGLFAEVFQALANADVLDFEKEQKRLYLKSQAAQRYLSGGWLEEYFYLTAKRAGLSDYHAGIDITDNFDRKKDIRNEIDGAATYANRVLLAECKTSVFGKDAQKDSSIVYKLDSIANQVGGIFHTSLLLSAQPLDHTTSKNRAVYNTARANAANIHVLAGAELLTLESTLKEWMRTGHWPKRKTSEA